MPSNGIIDGAFAAQQKLKKRTYDAIGWFSSASLISRSTHGSFMGRISKDFQFLNKKFHTANMVCNDL